jgi:hypothetical protein
MGQLTFFRILSFILLPIALLFMFMDCIALLMALSNPSVLLPVFLMAGMVIYIFTSTYFLMVGIDKNKALKPSLKDWIKVNAYVTLFFGFQFIAIALSVFYMNAADLTELANKVISTQPNMPSTMTTALFLKMLHGLAYFFFFLAFFLLVHITICFKLLKQHATLFQENISE